MRKLYRMRSSFDGCCLPVALGHHRTRLALAGRACGCLCRQPTTQTRAQTREPRTDDETDETGNEKTAREAREAQSSKARSLGNNDARLCMARARNRSLGALCHVWRVVFRNYFLVGCCPLLVVLVARLIGNQGAQRNQGAT